MISNLYIPKKAVQWIGNNENDISDILSFWYRNSKFDIIFDVDKITKSLDIKIYNSLENENENGIKNNLIFNWNMNLHSWIVIDNIISILFLTDDEVRRTYITKGDICKC